MNVTLWLAAALLTAQTCAAATPIEPLKLETDGGISGRGLGAVTIDVHAVEASDLRTSCKGTLTTGEESSLAALLESAHPESWKSSYAKPDNPHGGADRIHYTLTLGDHTTSWYGEDAELPDDLRTVRAALWDVRTRVLAGCAAN